MASDQLAPFRRLLEDAENTVETLAPTGNYANNAVASFGGGGGGQRIGPPFGGGGGGMDPWQTAVETRLSGLNDRAQRIEDKVGGIAVDLGRLDTKVGGLPTKGWTVRSLVFLLVLIAALVTFQGQIQSFIGLSSASSSHQNEAGQKRN
jgi:hypothetical protein